MSIAEIRNENILFIGNSITVHGKCRYWWGEWGMAATDKEKDYVHQMIKILEIGGATNFKCFNFFAWESMGHDRAETLQLLDRLLSEKWTVVVIQLGENVSDLTSLEGDYGELIDYISERQPDSRIVLMDNVWNLPVSHDMKCRVAEKKGVAFVDLHDLWGDESLLCGLGTKVRGEDEEWHVVEHNGVAGHPCDRYMSEIARRLSQCLGQK